MTQHVDNIGEPGARRRRQGALVSLALAGAVAIVLIITNAPRPARLLIAVPIGLAAAGFLQAREKTCVVRAALGEREVYERDGNTKLSSDERTRARKQAISVVLRSTMIALVAAAIAWVV
jgi:hypothetical protein